ncbi:MAG: Asp-tRNA(Asn)/Glu-tRNA(Gln) amidotransferase subunit GatB [Planctomycetota bacterium]|jgi:aspartyl-tRNA(Asn)/glutamyl-tRNA(Gln) amidotransferase subunit B
MEFETVIGLEVHVQLLTESKLFCGCANKFTHDKNSQVCPVCLGQPGVLPVLNKEAFEKSLKAGLAINCTIPNFTKFDRKHYYYPDLPKNYQISQYDLPLAEHGYLDIEVDGIVKRIGITRAHLEEDAGKLLHGAKNSIVDLNRTGTPLLEIVSEPDISTPQEARAYLTLLRQTLRYIGISDCNMQEGSLRCDANISIRPKGEQKLGVKNEIKNMNSFKGVENALELVREDLLLCKEEGREIKQVTWGYSIDDQKIFPMRIKEDANDYRYFPEPDLRPVRVSDEWIAEIKDGLPELPKAKYERFISQYSLSDYDAGVLTQEIEIADYFETVAEKSGKAKESANWIANEIMRQLNDRKISINEFPVTAKMLAELIEMLSSGTINNTTAKQIFSRLIEENGGSPREIVEKEGLGQVSDTSVIEEALEEAISANPKAVADIESGKYATAGFFVGKIMQALKGKGDPAVIGKVIAKRFDFDPSLIAKKKKK